MRYLFFLLVLSACKPAGNTELTLINNPANPKSQCSRLVADPHGDLYLTWIETHQDTIHEIFLSGYDEYSDTFSESVSIAKGKNWFVNWADMPGAYPFPDGRWLVYWLQMSGEGTYDYDIVCKVGHWDSGWSIPFILHNDGIAAEHGFVSVTPFDTLLLISWLDGRYSATESRLDTEHSHGSGAMTVRSAFMDSKGNISGRNEIDHRVCDCCQTDLAVTTDGAVLVYRDRSDYDIRDIYTSKLGFSGTWSHPQALVNDFWRIYGCPVNGPAISAKDSIVAVALYGEPEGRPSVKLIWSFDAGITYSSPVLINQDNTLGRVDVEIIDRDHVAVSWMDTRDDEADINYAIFNLRMKTKDQFHLAPNSPKRLSGFPKMLYHKNRLFFTYTDFMHEDTRVATVRTTKISLQ